MQTKVLSNAQVEQFIELGYVKVPNAYSRENALAGQDYLWSKLEMQSIDKNNKATWTQPMLHLRETYSDDVFQACHTNRLANAIEDLVGVNRWIGRNTQSSWGWWPVNFSKGSEMAWDVPVEGWHWDGIHFRHFLDSPDQGLLCLCLFSDIAPHGGGTLVAEGSHKVVARYLQEKIDGVQLADGIKGVNESHPWFSLLTQQTPEINRVEQLMNQTYTDANKVQLKVIETIGEAGDVLLCHPFLYHCASQNHLGVPRFMCNRTTPLKERLLFNRSDVLHSPLEISIQQAI